MLIFVGNSSSRYGTRIKNLALKFKDKKQIKINFIDPTDDIGGHYLAADVFLLCSRVESGPRVILEAQAFGLAIISTPVFGIAEQIPDSSDACFYAPGDVAHLGHLMVRMASNKLERNRLSQCSKINFSRKNNFKKMINLYKEEIQEACLNIKTQDFITPPP